MHNCIKTDNEDRPLAYVPTPANPSDSVLVAIRDTGTKELTNEHIQKLRST